MKRGALIVGALLLVALLLMLGLASLTSSVSRGQALHDVRTQAEARELALAGIAEARAKLNLDINFPPPVVPEGQVFSYTEPVRALDGTVRGYYTVTLEGRYLEAFEMLKIRSVGSLGPDPTAPIALARVDAEFDMAQTVRGGASPNPYYFEFRHWTD